MKPLLMIKKKKNRPGNQCLLRCFMPDPVLRHLHSRSFKFGNGQTELFS